MEKKCPYCAELIKFEAILCKFCKRRQPDNPVEYIGPETLPERACPFCAETIKTDARICRHCGMDIVERRCPYCAEMIGNETTCPHCDSVLTGKPKPKPQQTLPAKNLQGMNCDTKLDPVKQIQDKKSISPGGAAVLSFLIPGLGQIYNGHISMGIMFLIGYVCSIISVFTANSLLGVVGGCGGIVALWLGSIGNAHIWASDRESKSFNMSVFFLILISLVSIHLCFQNVTTMISRIRDQHYIERVREEQRERLRH